jgi:hypothetical protein
METPPPTPAPVSQPPQTQAKERTFGETLNTWMQIIGILIAAVWGVYTFLEKEVWIPKSAPVNISMNLQLKKVGSGSSDKAALTAVELNVSAMNPSTREVHLLPSAWIARGVSMKPIKKDDRDVDTEAADALQSSTEIYTVQRHAVQEQCPIVATGLLFMDSLLRPNEKVTRTIIFYVPTDAYDLLDVNATMPSGEDVSQIGLEWTVNEDNDLGATFYRVDKKGNHTPIQNSEAYTDKRLKIAWTVASSQVALWP